MPVLTEEKTRDIIVPPRWPDRFGGDNGGGSGKSDGAGEGFPLSKTQIGMWLLLTAVVMLFAGLTSAYVVLRGVPTWISIAVPRLAWVNTLIIVFSSFSLETARHALARRDTPGIKRWVAVTGVLGLCFLAGQLVVWRELVNAGVYLQSTLHSSFFYVLTSLHGVHVMGGLVGLAILFFKAVKGRLTPENDEPFKAGALYWHFMGAIWVYLFLIIMLA
jgi:cytochrome c oxidase subunit III